MIPEELAEMFEQIKTPVIFATGNEYPHATPMNWLWLKREKLFWFNPAGGTKKIQNLKSNRHVCFGTVEDMQKDGRGFIVWGEMVGFSSGFKGLIRDLFIKIRMLKEKSGIKFFNPGTYKFWRTYARHPDIHYSTMPWNAAFVRVKPDRVRYWTEDQTEKETEV